MIRRYSQIKEGRNIYRSIITVSIRSDILLIHFILFQFIYAHISMCICSQRQSGIFNRTKTKKKNKEQTKKKTWDTNPNHINKENDNSFITTSKILVLYYNKGNILNRYSGRKDLNLI